MTLQLHFSTFIKNIQRRRLSKTWHTMLLEREITKNNFLATGDVRKAKKFASAVTRMGTVSIAPAYQPVAQPTVIFSREMLDEQSPLGVPADFDQPMLTGTSINQTTADAYQLVRALQSPDDVLASRNLYW